MSEASIAQLRSRWKQGRWAFAVGDMIRGAASRIEFQELLEDLPYVGEVQGYIDLRGIPYSGAVPLSDAEYFDFSYAIKPKGSHDPELALNLGRYDHSRFVAVPHGVSCLAGSVNFCDFSRTRCRSNDWSYSGDIEGALFCGTDLRGCAFRDQRLSRCSFRNSRLDRAFFRNVVLDRCAFDGCSLTGTTFMGVEIEGRVSFRGCDVAEVLGLDGVSELEAHSSVLYRECIEVALEEAKRSGDDPSVERLLLNILEHIDRGANASEIDALVEGLGPDSRMSFEHLMLDAADVMFSGDWS